MVTPAQQVHAENTNLSGTENIEDAELFNEPVSEEDSESSETDEDTTEKKNDLDISENENKSEDISESGDEEKSETDAPNEIELEQSGEENLEESVVIQSIEPETLSEPEKPDDLNIGGYIESELDYNTPVYSSDADTYSDIPSSFPDDMDTLTSTYPAARNQNSYGTCWAFSSMGLAEFDLINDSPSGNGKFDSNTDLSELQLAYFTYNSVVDPLGGTEGDSAKYYNENATESYLNYGGNYEMASRRLAQWYGPVDESLVPYEKAADTIKGGLDDSYAFGQDKAHLENAYLINIKENAGDVKQQIMEHGAAGVMYYHNNSSLRWNETLEKYVYYDVDKSGGGHAVMIVGWNDNFSKDNFTGSSKPSKDGAWLIRNSWGDYASYFWMSYESASLADTAWVFDFSAEDGYDNNYQLDGGVQAYPDKEHKILANVFKTKQEEGTSAEILSAVSLSFTEAANVQYTVDIYTDLQDETNPYSGTKQENATTTGETAYAGIYTIPLKDSVTLKPGTSFAVVVSVNSAVLDYEQATSIATGEGLTTMIWDCQVSKGNNKSFYFSGGKFYPFYWGNYCVKAFTTDSEAEEPEEPQEKLEGLQEKDGRLYYFKNDEIDTTYTGTASYQDEIYYCENGCVAYNHTGFIKDGENWLYIEDGKLATGYTGIKLSDAEKNIWWYVDAGIYEPDYTGLVEYNNILWYVEKGVLNWGYSGTYKSGDIWWNVQRGEARGRYSGFAEDEGKWLYIEDGKLATGYTGIKLQDETRNIWWYVEAGVYDPSYTGLVEFDSVLFYVEKGTLNWNYSGAYKSGDTWWNVQRGEVRGKYSGFAEDEGKWLYIEDGKLVTGYTGIKLQDETRNIWWYVEAGVYDPSYTGLVEFDSVLFYVEKGTLNWNYRGAYKSGETWWEVQRGEVKGKYSGFAEDGEQWLYIKDGEVATGYTGIVLSDASRNVWWYVKAGVYDPSYTGLVEYDSVLFYVENGILNWKYTGNVTYNERQYYIVNGRVFYTNCEITKCAISSVDGNEVKVTLSTQQNAYIEEMYDLYYIVLLDSTGQKVISSAPIREFSLENNKLILSSIFESSDSFAMEATGRYALATKAADQYEIRSNSLFISNPEAMARQDESFKDKYWGYYEGYKVYSKKGIQGADKAYTADLGVQHVLLNVDIQDLVSAGPQSGYVPYTYKGTTFYFSDLLALKKDIYDLHGWGSDDGNSYGENISRNVTLVLLMSWKHDELSYLIHPAARIKGAAPYYSLNMQDEYARNTFEALFCYMGDELGQMKTRVNNWTLGNELNSCNAWNYAGSMFLNDYVANYAQAFQMLHQAVRRTAASPRLFISLDHCWNTADAGFTGKTFLDTFASYMNQTAPDMEWNVNYHSYSQPLSNNAFWNDWWNTTDDISTRYISMRNISVLTNYLFYLEQIYGKKSGSIRVIIGELGYTATKGGAESQQAAALGYGYYIAMANKRIDSYIIRAYVDDPTEAAAGLYLGLNADWGYHVKKEAYEVYKYLDRNQSFDYMNRYLGTIGIGSWESAISGFNASEITAGERMFQ